jgi:multidrug efflux pump subunit AcrB
LDELSLLADHLSHRLAATAGLQRVEVVGSVSPVWEVRLDPSRLASYGLSPLEVAHAISYANVELPGGLLQVGAHEVPIHVGPTSGADLSSLALGGARLGDVADIRLVDDATSWAWSEGAPAVVLRSWARPDEAPDRMEAALGEALHAISGTLPPQLRVVPVDWSRAPVVVLEVVGAGDDAEAVAAVGRLLEDQAGHSPLVASSKLWVWGTEASGRGLPRAELPLRQAQDERI